jgi:hypothetical protein
MNKYFLLFLFFIGSNASAAEYSFQDSECKLLVPVGYQVQTTIGDKSEAICVTVGNEASCNYKNLESGKSHGQPTKYEVLDLDGVQIWTSMPSGNIKILLDKGQKRFIYGMTAIVSEQGILLNKQCVGKIVRQIK